MISSTIFQFMQSLISLQEFQDAEPDLLAHSASAIIERINEYGLQCNVALKALCRRKKGLNVEVSFSIDSGRYYSC